MNPIAKAVRVWQSRGFRAMCLRAWGTLFPRSSGRYLRSRIGRLGPDAGRQTLIDLMWNGGGGMIRPKQVKAEFTSLLDMVFADPRPACVMEIGTWRGGSLFVFSRLADPQACVISVDLPGGRFGGGYPEWKTSLYRSFARPGQELHLLRADSHDPRTRADVATLLKGRQLDFLFIDGDHTYEGVKRDFEMYGSLVKPGGTIAMHDIIADPQQPDLQTPRFWQDIRGKYTARELVQDPKQSGYGIGVIRVAAS